MIVDNVQKVLGIELFAASQAIWLRGEKGLATATQAVYDYIRESVDPVDRDVVMHFELKKFDEMIKSNEIVDLVESIIGLLK